jgi:hypothetical protein
MKLKGIILLITTTVTSSIFAWIGALMTHGNYFSGLSLILGLVGTIPGYWLGYKIYGDYLE